MSTAKAKPKPVQVYLVKIKANRKAVYSSDAADAKAFEDEYNKREAKRPNGWLAVADVHHVLKAHKRKAAKV